MKVPQYSPCEALDVVKLVTQNFNASYQRACDVTRPYSIASKFSTSTAHRNVL